MEFINLGMNAASNVVHCPFNHSHTMPQKTFVLHMTKCPDRKPNYSTCSFSNLHVMETSKLKAHEAQCPSRLDYDQMMYTTTNTQDKVTLTVPRIYDDEDLSWDDDSTNGNIPVQNVIQTINQTPCLMKPPVGCSKSERKKYRSEAQKTYQNVDLSYKPNSSINARTMTSNVGKNVNQGNQEDKNKGLFFGKRPNL